MKREAMYWIVWLLGVQVLLGGCYNPGGGVEPLVFPNEGRAGPGTSWGTTHVMMIDTNYLALDDQDEWNDISPDRIKVIVRDEEAAAFTAEANVRAVFDISPDSWSILSLAQHGLSSTVVIFDLPSHQAMGFPLYSHDVSINIELDGIELDSEGNYVDDLADQIAERSSSFTITANGGSPQELMWANLWPGQESWLQRSSEQAVIRLRAKRQAFSVFEGQQIGSVEFDIRYNVPGYSDCVDTVVSARTRSEANGLAMVGIASNDSQHVVLVSPTGFGLTVIQGVHFDLELVGEGPFLDLLVEKGPGAVGACVDLSSSTNWFEIWDLKVTNIDGEVLVTFVGQVPVDSPGVPPVVGAAFHVYQMDST